MQLEHQELGEDYDALVKTKCEYAEYIDMAIQKNIDELKNLIVALALNKKNPIIVGESGVGKTSLVDELAYRIILGDIPGFLNNRIIFDLDPNAVVSGTQYRGLFEEKMLKTYCKTQKGVI